MPCSSILPAISRAVQPGFRAQKHRKRTVKCGCRKKREAPLQMFPPSVLLFLPGRKPVYILLQTQAELRHFPCGTPAHMAIVPGLMDDTRYLAFSRGIAKHKPVFPAVLRKPSLNIRVFLCFIKDLISSRSWRMPPAGRYAKPQPSEAVAVWKGAAAK